MKILFYGDYSLIHHVLNSVFKLANITTAFWTRSFSKQLLGNLTSKI